MPVGPGVNPLLRAAVDRELIRRLEKAVPGDVDDLPLLTRLASRMEPAARRAFLAAVRGAAGVISLEGLAQAVRAGQVTLIEAQAQVGKLSDDLKRQILPVLGRTFALGAQVGADAVPDGPAAIAYGFDLRNPEAIRWVQERGAELVTNVSDSTRSAIRALVEIAQREGRHPFQTAREIREVVGLLPRQAEAVQRFRERLASQDIDDLAIERRAGRYADAQLRARAVTIARTETLMASGQGQQSVWEAAKAQGLLDPARTQRVWLATNDDILDTFLCEPMADVETPLDEPWTLPDGRRVMVPTESHPRCVVGSTRVWTPTPVEAVTDREYKGRLVELTTALSQNLSCTPNHPILTRRGWLRADMLRPGDEVAHRVVGEMNTPMIVYDEHDNAPLTIKELAETARQSGQLAAERVMVAPEDFHGDGIGSQVAVIWADRDLRRELQPTLRARESHAAFQRRHPRAAFDGVCDADPELTTVFRPARGSMSGGHSRVAFRASHPRPPSLVALADLSPAHVSVSHLRRALGIGHSGPASPRSLGALRRRTIWSQQDSGQGRADLRFPDAVALAQLAHGSAPNIQFTRLTRIIVSEVSGVHVFNLQSGVGWYSAGGIITHNCRCSAGLTFGDRE